MCHWAKQDNEALFYMASDPSVHAKFPCRLELFAGSSVRTMVISD